MRASNHLLLIAVGQYAEWPHLRGPEKDVDSLRDVLFSRYGFLPENTLELRNRQATRQGILSALEKLIEEGQPTDNLLIYYSGHGSLDERFGTGYWIPHDASGTKTSDSAKG